MPAQNAVSLDVKKTQAMMPQGAADQKTLLEILIGAANVFVAIVVGGIAYYAQQAANRDSVTGLLDYVSAAREKAVEEYVVWYKQTHAPDFNTVPENIKKDMIEMLDNAHRTKRGLDFARHKLLIKADKAWGLGDSLQRGMSGLNPAADRDHDELVQALKDKYLKESDVSRNEPGGILDKS